MITKIDHIGIAVNDMENALSMYKKVYGLEAVKIETLEEVETKIAFLPLGEVLIEFLSPTSPGAGKIGRFLDENGDGFHHIAFRVDDINGTMARIKKFEIPFRDPEPRVGGDGAWISFIEPDATLNVLTELVERKRELTSK
jgi:methylmalonyl-CoA/ethylmalonyl-CoA epimerase